MTKSRFCSLCGFAFAMIVALMGCAGSHSSNTNGGNTGSSAISVSISPASATVAAGATQQFSASMQNSSNQNVTWSVDGVSGGNSANGAVNSSGLYTAPATAGSHSVTATSAADTSKSATAKVTVTASNSSLLISPTSVHLAAGASKQFAAINGSGAAVVVSWSVDGAIGGNPTVGTISANGLYTGGPTAGTHTVTATSTANPNIKASAQVLPPAVVLGSVAVTTFHNDNARTGQNLAETSLTPIAVTATTFGKVFSLPVDGQVYAQPLYVPNLAIAGAGHNVLIVATEHDSVYAFDADGLSTAPLWKASFVNPAAGVTSVPSCEVQNLVLQIVPEVGITSTPAIDSASHTVYVVAETKENGVYTFKLHALDLTTGTEKFGGPVVIQGMVTGSSPFGNDGAGHVLFTPGALARPVIQRTALALSNGLVYVAFASHQDNNPYHGWIFAYNAQSLAPDAIFNTTPNGQGAQGGKGGIWQSGAAPAIDSAGNLFLQTANGTFDAASGGVDYGDTALKLTPNLTVLDWFAPFNEATLQQNDLDLGAGGVVALPDQSGTVPHLLIGGSKEGRVYLLNRDSMGRFNPAGDSQIVQEIAPGVTGPIFSTPAFWNQNIYFFGVKGAAKQFALASDHLAAVAQAPETFAFPGATPSVSANNNTNAIVWAIQSDAFGKSASCSAAPAGGPAVLRAYDATNISKELYNSSQAGARDLPGTAIKFTVPTVVNGHVYVGTANQVTVFGPLP